MRDAVDAAVLACNTLRSLPRDATQAQIDAAELQAVSARTRLGLVLSENAHRDVLTPQEAIREQGDLVVGKRLVCYFCNALPPRDDAGYRLDMLLATAELGQLQRDWLGIPADELPPLEYRLGLQAAHLMDELSVLPGRPETGVMRGTSRYLIGPSLPGAPGREGNLVHEAWHSGQSASPQFPDRERYSPRQPSFAHAAAISRSLEAARAMPMLQPSKPGSMAYFTDPLEVNATGFQSIAVDQASDSLHANQFHLENCGLELLKPLLGNITGKLDTRSYYAKAQSLVTRFLDPGQDNPRVEMRPSEAEYGLHAEEIVRAVASLNRMAGSQAWTKNDAMALSERMRQLHDSQMLNRAYDQQPTQQLAEIADTLLEFHDKFIERHDLRAAIPAGITVSAEMGRTSKMRPCATLQELVDKESDMDKANEIFEEFESAKWDSGFVEAVEKLHESGEVDAKSVASIIMKLTGALMGIAPEQWTPPLRPEVHVYQHEGRPPALEGFNRDAPGQSRKTHFVAQYLQFHVPTSALPNADGIETRLGWESHLAWMAAKLAYSLGAGVAHEDPNTRWSVGGFFQGPSIGLLDDTFRAIDELRPMLLAAAERSPKGAPYLLYKKLLVREAARWMATGKSYQEGPRSAVKGAAREGDAQATELHLTQEYRRHFLPAVAYARAVKGTTPGAASYARLATLSPSARRVGQFAAMCGKRLSRDFMRAHLPQEQVSDANWTELHERGILHKGRLSSPEITAVLKRDMEPSLRSKARAALSA